MQQPQLPPPPHNYIDFGTLEDARPQECVDAKSKLAAFAQDVLAVRESGVMVAVAVTAAARRACAWWWGGTWALAQACLLAFTLVAAKLILRCTLAAAAAAR